jgi:O-antigen/teichoic acid export membrane protein
VGFAGNVVLARLLVPHDFGLVAIGTSLVYFISTLSDGGLGASLIRRPEPPRKEELQALLALQVGVALGLAFATASVAAPFGRTGWIVAVMASSMPLAMLQVPGRILLERSLSYHRLAVVEVTQVLTYQAWAIGFAVAGFGVWSLATGTVAMRAAAAVAMGAACPRGTVLPRFSWRRIRPLIGFGVRFQAAGVTTLVESQGVNLSMAAIANVSTLGLWSLARRLMEIPLLLFDSLWRVSFPTMSQLIARKEDVSPLIERATAMAAVGSGVILTGLAGSAPGLIPGVFGEQWRGAAGAVPPACLGLAIAGPISVATVGYLYAIGDASTVLRAFVLRMVTTLAVTLPLIPLLGAPAAGVGWLCASTLEGIVLMRAIEQATHARLRQVLMIPLILGLIATGVGWTISDIGGANLASGLVGGFVSTFLFLVGLILVDRKLLSQTVRFASESMRGAASRRAASDAT